MYKGYIDISPSHDEWAELYTTPENNVYGCLDNQYLIIHNEDGSVEDRFKWIDGGYKKLSYKQINNSFINKIKPRNIQQECAFDLLQDKNTACSGKPCFTRFFAFLGEKSTKNNTENEINNLDELLKLL